MTTTALAFESVSVDYRTPAGSVSAVDNVSLTIERGEIFGLVGESGCGKTTLAYSTLSLLPANATVEGVIRVGGEALGGLTSDALRRLRGAGISLVPQDTLNALDPTFSVGSQIVEVIRSHEAISRRSARARALRLLERVGIPEAARRFGDPPHRLSGGMRQRVAIAIAVANHPAVLVADEPTTALDVTIQAQILALLHKLRADSAMAVLVISHDLAVVAQLCDRVGVMYAGHLVEVGPADVVLRAPRHPYTQALLQSLPTRDHQRGELSVVPGEVPDPLQPPQGCRFSPRCPHKMRACVIRPPLVHTEQPSAAACWLEPHLAESLEAVEPESVRSGSTSEATRR